MIEKDLKQLRVDLQDFKERLEADDGVWYEEDLTTLSYAVELIDNLRNKQHKQMNKFLNGIINNNLKTFQLLSKKGKLEQHDYFEIIGKHNEFYDKEILSLYDYIEKLQDEKDVQALQVSHIKDRIQELQNAKTAVETTEHAEYFVTLVRSNEQLEKENDFLRRINTIQAERISEIIPFEAMYFNLKNKIKALKVADDRNGLKQNALIDKILEIMEE